MMPCRTAAALGIAALAGALLVACADQDAPGGGPCTVRLVEQVPLDLRRSLVLAPVRVNDTTVPMILDTGAERSAVTDTLVTRLGLVSDPRHGSLMSGVGGQGLAQNDALVSRLALGGYDPGAVHYAVIALPEAGGGEAAPGGIVGADVLAHFDLDLDVANRRLGLYDVHHCGGNFLPWAQPYTAVPLEMTLGGRITLPVAVDGHRLTALLDTGAGFSLLDRDAAIAVGVTPEALARDTGAAGFGAAGVNFNRVMHGFRSFAIGGDTFADPNLAVLDRSLREVDMLVGLDFLRLRHVWISYRTRQLFIAAPRRLARAAPP